MTRYRTIVADPPWNVARGGAGHWGLENGASRLTYPTMDVDAIAALPVRDLAEKRAHLSRLDDQRLDTPGQGWRSR